MKGTRDTGLRPDPDEIRRALSLYHPPEPGHVIEVCTLDFNGRKGAVRGGYFMADTEIAEASKAVAELNTTRGADAIYFAINPCSPESWGRSPCGVSDLKNRVADSDIVHRSFIFIDFDPKRPTNVMATNAQHDDAIARAMKCAEFLEREGFERESLIVNDSGNGAHVTPSIYLPNDPDSLELVGRFLEVVKSKFNGGGIEIDLTTKNAARLTKAYGTVVAKGFSTPNQPHRRARMLVVPEVLAVASRKVVEHVAAMAPKANTQSKRPTGGGNGTRIDLEEWLNRVGLIGKVGPAKPWKGGSMYEFIGFCPFSSDHDSGAYVAQYPSGALDAKCQHSRCTGKRWKEPRELYEPAATRQRAHYDREVYPEAEFVTDDLQQTIDDDDDLGQSADQQQDSAAQNGKKSTASGRSNRGAEKKEPPPWEPPSIFYAPHPTPFPIDALPKCIADFVRAESAARQTPPDLAANYALAALGFAVSNKARVQGPNHSEPLNIYNVTVLDSGERKTAVKNDAVAGIEEFERDLVRETDREISDAKNRLDVLKAAATVATKKAADNPQSAALVAAARSAAYEARRAERELIPEPQLLADNATMESLGSLLFEQNSRLAVISDEGDLFDIAARDDRQVSSSRSTRTPRLWSGNVNPDRKGETSNSQMRRKGVVAAIVNSARRLY